MRIEWRPAWPHRVVPGLQYIGQARSVAAQSIHPPRVGRVDRILVSVYVIVGFFCGLAAFVLSARLNSSEAVAGIGYELTVISAVVIGGTSLFGGRLASLIPHLCSSRQS